MKFLVLAALVAVCYAKPQVLLSSPLAYSAYASPLAWSGYPYVRSINAIPYTSAIAAPAVAAIAPAVVASKYHAQDVLGQTSFGHLEPFQSRAEVRDLSGNVRGSYSYVDPNGKVNIVEYSAGQGGFRVLGANNLPEAPVAPEVPELKAPEPVMDTPEVMAARAEHARKIEEAKSRQRRGVLLSTPYFAHATPIVAAPALAKTTLKFNAYEPVDAAVPASTRKLELKEKETEVLTPLTYSAIHAAYPAIPAVKLVADEKTPVEVKTIAASPLVYNYGFPYAGYPYVL